MPLKYTLKGKEIKTIISIEWRMIVMNTDIKYSKLVTCFMIQRDIQYCYGNELYIDMEIVNK